MICEVDVPAKNKKGLYGKDCDENNICYMSIEKLELLLNDTNEAFGHGLCLAYSLLLDLKKVPNIISYFNLYNDATLINVYDKDLFTKIQHACRDLSTLDLKTLETFTCMNQFHPSGFRVDLIDFHVEGDKPELIIWCSAFLYSKL